MNTANGNVVPGQRVITRDGTQRTVAFITRGVVYVYGLRGTPEPARVVCDAWGGEHTLELPTSEHRVLPLPRPAPRRPTYAHRVKVAA